MYELVAEGTHLSVGGSSDKFSSERLCNGCSNCVQVSCDEITVSGVSLLTILQAAESDTLGQHAAEHQLGYPQAQNLIASFYSEHVSYDAICLVFPCPASFWAV